MFAIGADINGTTAGGGAVRIKTATGCYSHAGYGYCLTCAECLTDADIAEWDFTGSIVCDNCGVDTGSWR